MPLRTQTDEQPTLNIIPLIDTVLFLLIFFMVSTKFSATERKIGLRVPEVAQNTALTAAPDRRVVNVYRDGTITLDQQAVSLAELTRQLAAARTQYNDLGVLVRGDAEGRFQEVAEVLNACKQARIQELAISVRLAAPRR